MAKSGNSSKDIADAYAGLAATLSAAGVQGLDGRSPSSSGASAGKSGGPAPSSPGGGAQAAAGWSDGSREVTAGPAPSSPGGGMQAAGGWIDGSRTGLAPAAGITPPSISARSAQDSSMAALAGLGGLVNAAGLTPSARQAETASMRSFYETQPVKTSRDAETMSMDRQTAWQNALSTIRSAEGNYKSISYASSYGKPTRDDLTSMTLQQVMDWQEEQDNSKGKSYRADRTYAGAYQIGRSTLREAVARTGLDPATTKFTPAVQDYLAMDLAANRARQASSGGTLSDDDFALSLAKEWAGLATSSGKSYYAGRSGNRASVEYEDVLEAARGLVDSGAVQAAAPRAGQTQSFPTLPDFGPIPESRPETVTVTLPDGSRTTIAASQVSDAAANAASRPSQAAGNAAAAADAAARFGVNYLGDASPDRPDNQNYQGPRGLGGPGGLYVEGLPPQQGDVLPGGSAPAEQKDEAEPASPPASDLEKRSDEGRSTGRQIAATGIDVGIGTIPGVGLAATGFNVLAGLTGNRTLGERIVDVFGNGGGGSVVTVPGEYGGTGSPSEGSTASAPSSSDKAAETRFVDRYLGFIDDTSRPTPREKWGRPDAYGRAEYAA